MWEQSQIKRTLNRPESLARVNALLQGSPELHRTALADQVCAAFGFLDARGRVQRAGCLKALRALERAGRLMLPPACSNPGRRTHGRRLGVAVPAPQGVGRAVTELAGLELVRVDNAGHRALWNELMAREHPRGMGPLVGAQVRYLVGSAQGWLGALGFAASALQLAARDAWIGWDPALRERHRHRVVGLNRFLLRPGVACRNLASWTLGRALRRLGADFEACHGYRPWLVETFIEPPHTGVSLRASNWRRVGETGGRGRQDRGHAAARHARRFISMHSNPIGAHGWGWVRRRRGATRRWNPPKVWMRSNGPSTSSGVRPWGTSD
jgi:hypothetical protein